jgi:hypothetical protein
MKMFTTKIGLHLRAYNTMILCIYCKISKSQKLACIPGKWDDHVISAMPAGISTYHIPRHGLWIRFFLVIKSFYCQQNILFRGPSWNPIRQISGLDFDWSDPKNLGNRNLNSSFRDIVSKNGNVFEI